MAKIKSLIYLHFIEDLHYVLLIPINYLISLSLDLGSILKLIILIKNEPSGISTNGFWVLWNSSV